MPVIELCGAECELGSPCILPKGHDAAHETEHGCVFLDEPTEDQPPEEVED